MALGARELWLVIRARDEASRVLRGLAGSFAAMGAAGAAAMQQFGRGVALTSLGVGIAAVGVALLKFYASATSAAIKYNQASALTLTQVDQVGVKLKDIKQIGKDVAKSIPAPFEQMQKSLYDIFSSMDVNVGGAKILLREFARAAVAGQVDIQEAARGTIGILNAYNMKAEDVTRVNDVMFQLVRKGVGTYGEFAATIGRSVPSAVRAGQSIEDLAGMLAFLTRNGLSAAMASASAGRALDAMAHPKVATNLLSLGKIMAKAVGKERAKELGLTSEAMKKMGVSVKDAQGNFRPMSDLMTELAGKMKDLSQPERAAVLFELFKGAGGTIQARRFFDTAITGFRDLNSLTDHMHKSSGAMQSAYDIMFKQPQSQAQLLKNNVAILKTEIGDALIPVVLALTQAGVKLLQWWNGLDPTIKKTITIIGAVIAVFLLLAGIVIAVVGFITMLAAAAVVLGTSLAVIIGVAAAVAAAVIIVIAIIVLVIKYHKQIWAFLVMVWSAIASFFVAVWNRIYAVVTAAASAIWNFLVTVFSAIGSFLVGVWNGIVSVTTTVWATVVSVVRTVLTTIWAIIVAAFNAIRAFIVSIWTSGIAQFLRDIFFIILHIVRIGTLALLAPIIQGFTIIVQRIRQAWDGIRGLTQMAWIVIKAVVSTAMNAVGTAVSLGMAKTRALVSGGWNFIKSITSGAWNFIKSIVSAAVNGLSTAVSMGMGKTKSLISGAWSFIKSATNLAWQAVKAAIVNPLSDAVGKVNAFLSQINRLLEGFASKVAALASKIRGALAGINPLKKSSPSIVDRATQGMRALRATVNKGLIRTYRVAKVRSDQIRRAMAMEASMGLAGPNLAYAAPTGPTPTGEEGTSRTSQTFGPIIVNTQEIDPRKHAAELGWEISRRVT